MKLKYLIVGLVFGALFLMLFIAVGEYGATNATIAETQRLQALAEVERVRGETAVAMTNARADAFSDKLMVFSVAMNSPLLWVASMFIVAFISVMIGYHYGMSRPIVTSERIPPHQPKTITQRYDPEFFESFNAGAFYSGAFEPVEIPGDNNG